MIFLNAISQPYNLTNLIPSMTYVVISTLLSLWILIYLIKLPFLFDIQLAKGIMRRITMIPSMPGQPKRVTSNTAEPTIVKGKPKDWNMVDSRL